MAFSRIFVAIGPGSIRMTSIPVPLHLDPQHIGQPLHRELGRHIGPAPGHADQAQDRGAVDDPPMALRPHQRDHPAGQVVIAEEVGLEDLAQGAARQVLDRAGTGEGPVVVKRIQRAAGARASPRSTAAAMLASSA
jgi:hypothetical protein